MFEAVIILVSIEELSREQGILQDTRNIVDDTIQTS